MEGFDLPMSFGKKPTAKKPSKTLANVAKTERTVSRYRGRTITRHS
jgi:hypothetical protein